MRWPDHAWRTVAHVFLRGDTRAGGLTAVVVGHRSARFPGRAFRRPVNNRFTTRDGLAMPDDRAGSISRLPMPVGPEGKLHGDDRIEAKPFEIVPRWLSTGGKGPRIRR